MHLAETGNIFLQCEPIDHLLSASVTLVQYFTSQNWVIRYDINIVEFQFQEYLFYKISWECECAYFFAVFFLFGSDEIDFLVYVYWWNSIIAKLSDRWPFFFTLFLFFCSFSFFALFIFLLLFLALFGSFSVLHFFNVWSHSDSSRMFWVFNQACFCF